jgi:hypothetical protein
MPVLDDILEWSADRPGWQRDALRRIVSQAGLIAQDREELLELCLAEHGIAEPEAQMPVPVPLAEEHFPANRGAGPRVRLRGIRDVRGVNALAEGQAMSFGRDGLTIVFGYNGAGKSGYARLLRQVCRARVRGGPLLPNVFAANNQASGTATIEYQVDQAERTEVWTTGNPPPMDLSRVSFFDADCAGVHVDAANEIAFTPFGLDVLPRLVEVCQSLRDAIQEEIDALNRAQPRSVASPMAAEGTAVRIALTALTARSDVERFRLLSTLTEVEAARMAELNEALGADPIARARELDAAVARMRRLRSATAEVMERLSAEAVEEIRTQIEDLNVRQEAANAAAQLQFADCPLVGIGSEAWRVLWQAARRYSEEVAYVGEGFPTDVEGAKCVLCQQTLEPMAQRRLTAFDEFVRAEAQRAADTVRAELQRTIASLGGLSVGADALAGSLTDVPEDAIELRRALRTFHRLAWMSRKRVVQSAAERRWTAPYPLTDARLPDLGHLIETIEDRAATLRAAAADADRAALIRERDELLARRWLGSILGDVELEIARRGRIAALETALRATNAAAITRKSGELADTYVTEVLRTRLADETRMLGAQYLRIELDAPGARQGQKRLKLALTGMQGGTKVGQVLSEGEFRCVALAGFLAELATDDSSSAVVFDDPVSSLDHRWRRKVAKRLVRLAADRQVIVFTHEIAFYADLVKAAELRRCEVTFCSVERVTERAGMCSNRVPWAAMKVAQRIGSLKNDWQAADACFRREGAAAYEPHARRIYGGLRASWERAIEEVLLNGVVVRFQREVHTQQLRDVVDISDEDLRKVDQAMTHASRFIEGHDEAEAVMDPVPEPAELQADIQMLETWVAEVRRRRNRRG